MRFTFILFLLFTLACNSKKSNEKQESNLGFNEDKEKAEMLKVIEKETDCFFKRDYDCWQACYAQTEYAFQAWNNENGTFNARYGWDEVSRYAKEYLKNNPVQERKDKMGEEHTAKVSASSHPDVVRKNINAKFFSEKLAYLIWDQYNSDAFHSQKYYYSKDSRIMEKINGDWKIVNVTSYWDYRNPVLSDSLK